MSWFRKQRFVAIARSSAEFFKETNKSVLRVMPRKASVLRQDLPNNVYLLTGANIRPNAYEIPYANNPRATLIPYREIKIKHRLLDDDGDLWGAYVSTATHKGRNVVLYFSLSRPGLVATSTPWSRMKSLTEEAVKAAKLSQFPDFGIKEGEVGLVYSGYGLSKVAETSGSLSELCSNLRRENGRTAGMIQLGSNRLPITFLLEDAHWSTSEHTPDRLFMEIPKLQLAVSFRTRIRITSDGNHHVSVPSPTFRDYPWVVFGVNDAAHVTFFDPVRGQP